MTGTHTPKAPGQDASPANPTPAMQADAEAFAPPDGWRRHDIAGFFGLAGPLYSRQEPDGWAYGFLAGAQHANPAGVIHGGMLVTLLDQALSALAWQAADRQPCLTIQLDSQFIAAARPGDFLVARGQVRSQTASMLFLQGDIHVGDRLCLSGSAVMKCVSRQLRPGA